MIPEQVKVGPHRISIICDMVEINQRSNDSKTDLDGQIEYRRNVITIRPGMHPDQEAETLLHEVLHAIFKMADLDGDEESTITRLAPALLDTLRRNPALVMYLMGWGGLSDLEDALEFPEDDE